MKRSAYVCAGVALLFSSMGGAAHAFYYCSEASPPSCIDRYGSFDDEYSFDRCKREVESYLSEVEDFRSCLADAHRQAGDDADAVVERFNCKAQGRSYCP